MVYVGIVPSFLQTPASRLGKHAPGFKRLKECPPRRFRNMQPRQVSYCVRNCYLLEKNNLRTPSCSHVWLGCDEAQNRSTQVQLRVWGIAYISSSEQAFEWSESRPRRRCCCTDNRHSVRSLVRWLVCLVLPPQNEGPVYEIDQPAKQRDCDCSHVELFKSST